MEDKFTMLKDSIIKADLATAKSLVSSLDTISMRNLLDRNIDGENCIALALRYGHQEIAFQMLITSANATQLSYEDFTWLKLFDLVSAPRVSFGQLVYRLKYATPLLTREPFPLQTLAHKPKYIKTALALGAMCSDAKALGQAIMESTLQHKQQMDLLNWLATNNHLTSQPLPPKTTLLLLRGIDKMPEYLQRIPDWFLDQDSLGNTVVHYATQLSGVRVRTFNKLWGVIRAQVNNDQTKLVAVASQPNKAGQIPAVRYLSKYLGDAVFPLEFIAALKEFAQCPQLYPFYQNYMATTLPYDTNNTRYTMLYLYLLQQGREKGQDLPNLQEFLQTTTQCSDFNQFFHFIDKKAKQKQLETANIQCSRSFSLSLFNIPQELLKEILSHMAPHDLTKLFSCSKKLKGELQKMFAGNELFWHNYHNKYFHCVEEQQGPYRTKVQQRLKTNSGWRQNKYSTIELSGKPELMDENWLILSHLLPTRSLDISYWNCHSQQLSDVTVNVKHANIYYTILKSSHYNGSRVPKFLVGFYNAGPILNVVSEKDSVSLKNIPSDLRLRMTSLNRITCVNDNHLFIPGSSVSIYDIEHQDVVVSFPTICDSVVNPYNSTFISLPHWANNNFIITDWKTGQKTVLPQEWSTGFASPTYAKFVDEHTLFYHRAVNNHYQPHKVTYASESIFVDLRTGGEISSVKHLIPNCFNFTNVPASNDRLFLHSTNLPLVSSWHLPTRKFEWIQPAEHTPKTANSRYLVLANASKDKTFVQNYASW